MKEATVADSLMATSRVYTLFQNITPEQSQDAESDDTEVKVITHTKIKTAAKPLPRTR